MPGVERTIQIRAPIDTVFDVITDYEKYPDFLPETQAVSILENKSGIKVVRFELELVMRIHYTLKMTEASPDRVAWTLVDSNMLKRNEGAWSLRSTGDGTEATYGLEVKLRGIIPKSVSTRLMGTTLPMTLDRFKKRAESMC